MNIEAAARQIKVFSVKRTLTALLFGVGIEFLAHRLYYFNFILNYLQQEDPTTSSVMRTLQDQLNAFFSNQLFGRIVLGLVWAVIGGMSCYIIWAVANTSIAIKNARIMMDSYANRATNGQIIIEAALKVLSLSAPWLWLLILTIVLHPLLLGWSQQFLQDPGNLLNWLLLFWSLSGLTSTMYMFMWLLYGMRFAFRPDN